MQIKKHYRMITVSLPVGYHAELVKLKKKLNVSLQDLVILSVSLFIEGKERHKLMQGGVKMPGLEKLKDEEPTEKELEEIKKFKDGVKRSTEEAESKRWGPDDQVPIDLARMGAEQVKVYKKFKQRIEGFSDTKVIPKLAGLKNNVSRLLDFQ